MDLRFDAHPRLAPHVKSADALGAVKLVRGKRHQVHLHFLQVDVELAGALGRVDMENHLVPARHLADGLDVVDHADFVVDVHQGDQDSVRP